jgi:dihydrofolate reductase
MPRKIVAYELLSLDGVAEDCDRFITEWDDAMDENLGRVIATQDTVILGRRMYDEWAKFWPTSTIEPFSSFINSVEKYVVTSTALDVTWGDSTVVDGDLADFLSELKQRSGGDIGLHGSIELTKSLIAMGLVDELRLVVAPTLQGRGRKLLDGEITVPLTLVRSVTSPAGYLLVDYLVKD